MHRTFATVWLVGVLLVQAPLVLAYGVNNECAGYCWRGDDTSPDDPDTDVSNGQESEETDSSSDTEPDCEDDECGACDHAGCDYSEGTPTGGN